MRKKHVAEKLLQATEGLVATATDLILFLTILPFSMGGAYTHGEVSRRIQDVLDLVGEDLNYRTIKTPLENWSLPGLLQSAQNAMIWNLPSPN